VVRSQKDKAWDAIQNGIKKVKNSMRINDWGGIQTGFEDLNKLMEKSKTLIEREGMPQFYIRLLAQLEDLLAVALKDKEAIKKMNSSNSRSLNRMKLVLKKHNKNHEAALAKYRENPVESEGEESADSSSSSDSSSNSDSSDSDSSGSGSGSDSGSDSDSDSDSAPKTKAKKPKKALEDLDSDEWPSESESSSSESEDETQLKGRARWLKKTPAETTKKAKKPKDEKERAKRKKEQVEAAAAARAQALGDKAAAQQGLVRVDENITAEELEVKVLEAVASRGRRGTNIRDLLRQLQALAYAARKFGPRVELPVLFHLVSAQFDTTSRQIDDYMQTTSWKHVYACLMRVVSVLEGHQDLKLAVVADTDLADLVLAGKGELKVQDKPIDEEGEGQEVEGDAEAATNDPNEIQVVGTLSAYMRRINEEYVKSLQHINPHTQEYIARLKDEALIVALAAKVQAYYVRVGMPTEAASMCLMGLEHTYYKHDSIALAVQRAQSFTALWGDRALLHPGCVACTKMEGKLDAETCHPASALGTPTCDFSSLPDMAQEVSDMALFIYRHGDDRLRTRAMLCHITHHAMHDRFHQARDLLFMSHLQDTIGHTDVSTQILFNRAMVLLGLCAFRAGMILEGHYCMTEVCSGRTKELLAQGVQQSRYHERNPEKEKAEKRRQMPYHMHINLDLLECCHLTAAMLLEVPNIALDPGRKKVISRHFRKCRDIYSRQVFTGPPENTRDHVMASAQALEEGQWRQAAKLLLGLDVWNLIPGEGSAAKVKVMLEEKLKVEALRTYLFTYSSHYNSLSLNQLCSMFDMPKPKVHSLLSKMMMAEEIQASWDQPTETVVLHKVEPSPLQQLALQFAEKASFLVESNERLLDARCGGGAYREDWGRRGGNWNRDNRQGGGQNWRGNNRGGRGRGSDRYSKGGRGGRGDSYNKGGRGGGRGRGGWGGGRGGYQGRGERRQGQQWGGNRGNRY